MIRAYIQQIDGKYYAFAGDDIRYQVYSIGADTPREGTWFAKWTNDGIKYVSSPSPNRTAAKKKAQRHGNYFGEI